MQAPTEEFKNQLEGKIRELNRLTDRLKTEVNKNLRNLRRNKLRKIDRTVTRKIEEIHAFVNENFPGYSRMLLDRPELIRADKLTLFVNQ